jgi:hypothetical protein
MAKKLTSLRQGWASETGPCRLLSRLIYTVLGSKTNKKHPPKKQQPRKKRDCCCPPCGPLNFITPQVTGDNRNHGPNKTRPAQETCSCQGHTEVLTKTSKDTSISGSGFTNFFNKRLPNARDIARIPPTLHVSTEVQISITVVNYTYNKAFSTIWQTDKKISGNNQMLPS